MSRSGSPLCAAVGTSVRSIFRRLTSCHSPPLFPAPQGCERQLVQWEPPERNWTANSTHYPVRAVAACLPSCACVGNSPCATQFSSHPTHYMLFALADISRSIASTVASRAKSGSWQASAPCESRSDTPRASCLSAAAHLPPTHQACFGFHRRHAHTNALTGSLPSEIGQMAALTYLYALPQRSVCPTARCFTIRPALAGPLVRRLLAPQGMLHQLAQRQPPDRSRTDGSALSHVRAAGACLLCCAHFLSLLFAS